MRNNVKYAVVTDFDGTVTTFDIGDAICLHFGIVTKKDILDSYAMHVSVEHWMRDTFLRLKATPEELQTFILGKAQLRPGFKEFAQYCKRSDTPLEIASGGLDFYIKPLLKKWKLDSVSLYCGTGGYKKDSWLVGYPKFNGIPLLEYKAYRVRQLKEKGYTVIFCGDGPSDFSAAQEADIVFARYKLFQLCKEHGLKTNRLISFGSIIKKLKQPCDQNGKLCTRI